MVFEKAELDQNYTVSHWVSTCNRWELGHVRMAFGVRVRLSKVGEGYCILDLCAGADRQVQDDLLRMVMVILLIADEDSTENEIGRLFPCRSSAVKPIPFDPCWGAFQQRAFEVVQGLKNGSLEKIVGSRNRGVPAANEVHGAQTPE